MKVLYYIRESFSLDSKVSQGNGFAIINAKKNE